MFKFLKLKEYGHILAVILFNYTEMIDLNKHT